MPFIGNRPALSYIGFAKQDFTTSATTTYTLDYPVANENEIELFINNVRQEPTTAYTASGTTLTLTTATTVSDDMYAVFQGKAVQTITPPASSITNSMVASGAAIAYSKLNLSGSIVNADIASGAAIESSKLSITSPLLITGNSTAGSEIRLPEDTDNGSNYVALKAADSIASNLTFTLPSADGSANQALITNGSGSLSFATVGATAGQVIQVVTATSTTMVSTTSTSFVTASNGLSVTITPAATANKVFIQVSAIGYCYASRGDYTIYRDATNLGGTEGMTCISDNNGGYITYIPLSMSILDSPNTTSATTYQVYFKKNGSSTVYLGEGTAKMTITAFEIKG